MPRAPAMPADGGGAVRSAALEKRREQITTMLDRPKARGERPPSTGDVLVAPLYVRASFGAPASEAFAECLVERLLDLERVLLAHDCH